MGDFISAAALVIVAVIEAVALRERRTARADRERTERRAADRARESQLSMKMMAANMELSEALAISVERGQCNGELKAAKKSALEAKEEYTEFLEEIAARQIAKH